MHSLLKAAPQSRKVAIVIKHRQDWLGLGRPTRRTLVYSIAAFGRSFTVAIDLDGDFQPSTSSANQPAVAGTFVPPTWVCLPVVVRRNGVKRFPWIIICSSAHSVTWEECRENLKRIVFQEDLPRIKDLWIWQKMILYTWYNFLSLSLINS